MENAWSEGISDAPRETPSGRPPPWTTGTSSRPPPTRHSPTSGRSTTGPPRRHPRRWPRWPRSTSRSPTPAAIRPTRCGCSPRWAARPPSPRPAAATSASSSAPRTRWRWAAPGSPRAWDQNAALPVMSPVAARLHDVVPGAGWSTCCACPRTPGLAFVSGATVANASCLAAARDALLARLGWDVQADGLFGAPPLPVVIGERAHSTLSKSLGLVGLGRDAGARGARRRPGPAARRPAARPRRARCSSARRPARSTPAPSTRSTRSPTGWPSAAAGCTSTARSGCGRSPTRPRPHLVAGLDRADSWATDGHKWLNVTLRLRHRVRPPSSRTCAARSPPPPGYLPASDRVRGHAPHAAVVAAGPAGRGVGRAAHARPRRRRRAGRRGPATPPRSIADAAGARAG